MFLTEMLNSCWSSSVWIVAVWQTEADKPCDWLLLLLLCLIWPATCCRRLRSILALYSDTKGCLFTIHLPSTIENQQFHCTHVHTGVHALLIALIIEWNSQLPEPTSRPGRCFITEQCSRVPGYHLSKSRRGAHVDYKIVCVFSPFHWALSVPLGIPCVGNGNK